MQHQIEDLNHDGNWHVFNPETMDYEKVIMCVRRHDGLIICGWPNAGKVSEMYKPFIGNQPPYAHFETEVTHYRVVSFEESDNRHETNHDLHYPPNL
jgi:hypothetical protein